MTKFSISINGYDTYYFQEQDSIGKYLLIAIPQNSKENISDICGNLINGHLIKQIDYTFKDEIRFIKAYF